MSEHGLTNLATSAVILHAQKFVMPMVIETNNKAQSCGTAILVAHRDEFFLIAADHVAKYLNKCVIGVPASPLGTELWQIGNAERHACQYDLAIIHLHDQDLIDRIRSRWMPLNHATLSQPDLFGDAYYVIHGFPSSTSELSDGIFHSNPISLVTEDFDGETKGFNVTHPFDANVDHLLAYSTTARDPCTGNAICGIPPTEGMSGSPVWLISKQTLYDNTDLWSPESSVRLFGFYTSDSKKSGWLRVRRYIVVEKLLEKLGRL